MSLEAELEGCIQSNNAGQAAISTAKSKESWNTLLKPQVVDEEELVQISAWRAKRQLHRKEMAKVQLQLSRYTADTKMRRSSSKDKGIAMRRSRSEERIEKQFN